MIKPEELESRRFRAMMVRFVAEWAPLDDYARSQFEADFACLMRQLQIDLMNPIKDALVQAYMRAPPAPIIMEKR